MKTLTESLVWDLSNILTWWRTVDSDIRFPLTKVLAFSTGVILTVPWMFVITLKQQRHKKSLFFYMLNISQSFKKEQNWIN